MSAATLSSFRTAFIRDESYAMDYEYRDGEVPPIRYYHLGYLIDRLPNDLQDELLAEAYQAERERGVDFGDDDE